MNKSGVFGLTFDIISLSTDILSLCAEYSQDAKSSSADIDLLLKSINTVQTTAKQAHDVFRGPDGQRFMLSESLSEVLDDSHGSLVEIKKKLEPKPSCISSKKLKFGGPKWPYRRKDLEMVVDELNRQIDAISVALYLNKSHPTVPTLTFVQLCQHLFAVEQKETLARLPVASPAIFNSFEHEHSPVCLAGTRVDVLQEINEWAGDPFAKPLFWLNGMAGTGKTTILRTICYQLKASRKLGASFFFKREDNECGNISKLVSTIASQLAQMRPEVAPYIKAAIDKSPSIYHKTMEDQFSHLISGPLSKINLDSEKASSIVFIIDALDECDDDDDIRVIINLFSYSTGNIDMKVKPKFLISSRPELPIRVGFNAVKGTFQTAILHDIPDSVVRQDITTFLRHELARAKEEFDQTVSDSRQLSPNWPEESEIESLVDVSFPLFSVAATISRFIQNRRCGSPTSQLRKVFEFHPGCRLSDLDKTYMPILNGLVQNLTPTRRSKMIQRFQSVIGPFVNLASPLSTAALGELLGVPKSQINDQLDLLHSVLSVPRTSQQPPRLLHSSFGEFLSDPLKQGTNEFWIDENEIHKTMAANCLRIMEKHLKKNICQLGHAKSQAPPIDGPVLQSSVPPELRYACLYWAHHMQKAEMVIDDNHEIFKFLLEHLSHWVEVLAILKNTQESIQALEVLQSIMDENNSKALFKFVQEALQLVQHHLTTIEATPLQVYFVVDLQLMA